MPARVVVVKRARRRPFALLWAVPHWLRSVWAALRIEQNSAPLQENGGLFASEWTAGLEIPALDLEGASEGRHRCTGCGVCTEVCPSKALTVLSREIENRNAANGASPTGLSSSVDVIRFELDLDRCIGCGICVEDCPEDALMMRPAPLLALAAKGARASRLDLLEKGDVAG